MAVRRHLLNLRAAGLIQARIEHRPRGRPATIHSLTERGDGEFPKEYDRLAFELLSSIRELDGQDKINQVLRRRRQEMTARYLHRMKGKNLEERVREISLILSECGYMADVTVTEDEAFLLTEHNCALPSVAKSFPMICDEELCFIRDLADAEVTRVQHTLAGQYHCGYRIQEKSQ